MNILSILVYYSGFKVLSFFIMSGFIYNGYDCFNYKVSLWNLSCYLKILIENTGVKVQVCTVTI